MSDTEQRFAGVVARDPLRLLGLEQIVLSHGFDGVVPLSGPGTLDSRTLSVVLVDAACTDHLLKLLESFREAYPTLKLVVIGLEEDLDSIAAIIAAGAMGYLTHKAQESEIHLALDIVLDGSIWAPRKALARLVGASRTAIGGEPAAEPPSAPPAFTAREEEVLRLLVAGHSNREIAGTLEIDEGTVKSHIGRLLRKVGVPNRTALSVQALSRKLLM